MHKISRPLKATNHLFCIINLCDYEKIRCSTFNRFNENDWTQSKKKLPTTKKKTLFFSLFTKRSLWYFMDYLRTNTFSWAVYLLNENVEQWILVKHQNILFHSEAKVTARHYLNKRFIFDVSLHFGPRSIWMSSNVRCLIIGAYFSLSLSLFRQLFLESPSRPRFRLVLLWIKWLSAHSKRNSQILYSSI